MPDTKNKITYAFVKKTRKFSIILILVMLFSSLFNTIIVADGDLKPDLDILSIDFDHTVYEGDIVEVKVLIKNVGTKNISVGTRIEAELRIDDILVNTSFSNDGLDIDKTCYINISWTAEHGDETERSLEVEVNVEGMSELSYINNFISSSIFVFEGKVDLEFTGKIIIDGKPRMNEPIKIYANAKNSGRNTTENINVTLKIDGNYYDDHTINGLLRNEVYTVSFVWIPDDFGTAIINITIDPNDEIDEQDESNNNIEDPDVNVQHPRLDWWDTNWHYRKLYKITGAGNISESFNSTELLDELNIKGNTFENDTVTVVKYFLNGTVDCIVGNYSFNESAKELIWKVTDDTYYCVYFDVENNSGTRIGIPEIVDMQTSGSVNIDTGYVEGWWVRPVDEINTYYLPGVQITFKMESTAEIHNMTALLYLEGTFERTLSFTTTDNLIWVKKQTFQQSEIGNWSIEVSGYDDAGYLSEKFSDDFFIGYPDLVVDSISIVSDRPEGSQNYVDTDYTIKAMILVYNASVDNVNITMKINETYFDSTIKNISKNQNNMVSFIWRPTQKGFYTVTIKAELTEDSNQSNNQLSQNIIIEGIPDLKILNIVVPSEPVDEYSPAEIFVNITNIGEGNATNYNINLYCEQHDKNAMNYTGLKSTTTVDINVSETKSISLIWDSTEYGSDKYEGKWIIGVILVWDEEGYPDSDGKNNRAYNKTARLQVNEIERPEQNNPIITLIKPDVLEEFEQNLPVKIIAKITDESGIKSVDILIAAPDKTTYEEVMTRKENDKYSYTFENTHLLKIYNFTITAVDDSENNSVSTKTSNFTIVEDATPPEIEYIGVLPSVQLKDRDVTISSIVSDRSGVKFVQVTITYPDGSSETKNMTNSSNDKKYYFTQSYEMLGRYVFYITTEDTLGNEKTTKDEEVEFWITTDLEDTDSDGMPDWWEEKYGFDPRDPADADEDEDDDGYTNVEEYEDDTDPLEPLSLLQRIVKETKENWIYVVVSGILFIVVIALSIYGVRRRRKT